MSTGKRHKALRSNIFQSFLAQVRGVLRQKDEHVEADVPCTEANKCSLVQIESNHRVSDQNLKKFTHKLHKELKQPS